MPMPYANVLHTNKSCREVRFRSSSGESGEFESRISMRSSHLLNIQLLLTHLSSQCCHCIPLYLLPVIQCLNKKLSLIMAMCYRGHDRIEAMMVCRYCRLIFIFRYSFLVLSETYVANNLQNRCGILVYCTALDYIKRS